MSKLLPYDRALLYGYAPGVFPSHALLDQKPECARRLLIHTGASAGEGMDRLRSRCAALGIREETADRALQRISRKENCFAAIVFDKYSCALSGDAPHIVLHQPSDMGNLGTILRTCAGFGFLDIAIIRPAADHFDPRVVRASMGALFALRIQQYDHFDAYRAEHPAHALYPFMLKGSVPLSTAAAQQKKPFSLVFGNEATGLPEEFSALGEAVRIPILSTIDSLNLAVAVAIGAYAFSSQA